MRRFGIGIILTALILGVATVATVDPAEARVSRKNKKAARKLQRKGRRALKKQKYNAAIRRFIAAYQLHAQPSTVYYIAFCHKGLVHYKRAIGAFKHFLTVGHKRRHRRLMRKARKHIKEMQNNLGRLTLKIEPRAAKGAKITIDGKAAGTAPLAWAITMNPGERVLEVTHKEYVTYKRTLNVYAGRRLTLDILLKPISRVGVVLLSCSATGALISIQGGKPRPLPYSFQTKEGLYQARVTAPGHKPKTFTVRVMGTKTGQLRVNLEPLGRERRRDRVARRILPVRPPPRPLPPRHARSVPVYKRVWFWSVISAVVIGAGATAGYFIWAGSQQPNDFDMTHRFR